MALRREDLSAEQLARQEGLDRSWAEAQRQIGYVTPADVHCGRAGDIRAQRGVVLDAAYAEHPERSLAVKSRPPGAMA